MTALDNIAQAIATPAPGPSWVRLAVCTDLRIVQGAPGFTSWRLFVDFGSGSSPVAAEQQLMEWLQLKESSFGAGTAVAWAMGKTAILVVPAGNGTPIAIGFVGDISFQVL